MRRCFVLSAIFLTAFSASSKKLTDCLKPWQRPIMSIATISEPSTPVKCHPETNPCPEGITSVECQFSFRSFLYVCCEDREDMRAPICPKYHDTLNTFCGGSTKSSCPNGYKCLKSRHDPKIELCCRPNPHKSHPEPETSFLDHSITPQIIPIAPKKLITVSFRGMNFTLGQLVSNEAIDTVLKDPPEIYSKIFDNDKLYTVFLFDVSVLSPVTVLWFAPDAKAEDGRLIINEKKKNALSYKPPSGSESPNGTHILVVAVFEQKERWSDKELKRYNMKEAVDMKRWIKLSSEVIVKSPIAGTIFGYTSAAEPLKKDATSTEE